VISTSRRWLRDKLRHEGIAFDTPRSPGLTDKDVQRGQLMMFLMMVMMMMMMMMMMIRKW
jgi:hypothetical protein